MSIVCMNWALQQRLENCQQQILLYVIADSADPTGMTRHCDPEYMADRARMSRASMFRRLAELETLGLLNRFKSYSDRGAPIYEIRLDMSVVIDIDLRRRKDDDADDEGPKSQAETLVAETKVSPVRQAESHCCDSICPPVVQESPPNPPPGGSVQLSQGEKENEHFGQFFEQCQHWTTMSRAKAWQAFSLLTADEQLAARAASPMHAAACATAKRKSLDAHKLIAEKFWERYPNARLPEKPPPMVWIADGSAEYHALMVLDRLLGIDVNRVKRNEAGEYGFQHAPLSPDLLALTAYHDLGREWLIVEEGTKSFIAWAQRLGQWSRRRIEARLIETGESVQREINGRTMGMPVRKRGLRVPAWWPPHKDGTLSTAGPAVQPAMTADDDAELGNERTR